jgi:hypothetical protein
MEVVSRLGTAFLRHLDSSYSTSPSWSLVVVFFFLGLVVGFLGGCLFILVVQKLSSKHIEFLLRAIVCAHQSAEVPQPIVERRPPRPVLLEDFELRERPRRESPVRVREQRDVPHQRRSSARGNRPARADPRSDEDEVRRRVQSLS